MELQLQGLDSENGCLSLCDSDGKEYVLPLTAELRELVQTESEAEENTEKDVAPPHDTLDTTPPADTLDTADSSVEVQNYSPREIQALFRAGKAVAEVEKMSGIPAEQLNKLAVPIRNERDYIVAQACGYLQSQQGGDLTLAELVISRLVKRGVDENEITWDATRAADSPWKLTASYQIAGAPLQAEWEINTKARTLSANNDEATWLTETRIPAPDSPWRPLNMPELEKESAPSASAAADSLAETDFDIPQLFPEQTAISESETIDINEILASLEHRRGTNAPMPEEEEEFLGAHPAASEPEMAQDASILQLPERGDNSTPLPSAPTAELENQSTLPGMPDTPEEPNSENEKTAKKSKRRDRPAMPSWDEIVFGYSKDDGEDAE